jgi:hypothetical protein
LNNYAQWAKLGLRKKEGEADPVSSYKDVQQERRGIGCRNMDASKQIVTTRTLVFDIHLFLDVWKKEKVRAPWILVE